MRQDQDINNDYIEGIYRGAKEVFCNGIYVRSDNHPCGWDFISFEDFESPSDMFEHPLENYEVSGGCYDCSTFEGMTIEEVIKDMTGTSGWCFELSGVDNLN